MAIITISRQLGSLGTDIANKLNEEMRINYLDKESLHEELIEKYGISEEKFKRYDEKKPALWDVFSSDKDRYIHFMQTAMYEFAKKGHCIVNGRGGQVLFKNLPTVLRVRIVAPIDVRLERIKKDYNDDARLAEQIIRHSDHDRAGFHKFFFHVNWEDSGLYDLVVNTGAFSVGAAVRLIKDALKRKGVMEKQAEHERKLADICLSQDVITSIAYKEKIPVQFLEATAENGVVTLQGMTIVTENVDLCEQAARKVSGVKDVINEIHYAPMTHAGQIHLK